ncbi:hypothetical protein [Erwinia aphidicola]|uniref:hypothetical protein n=1 Tax=Erwinia aphidicola TaxID=68334 RepID=UPI0030D50965
MVVVTLISLLSLGGWHGWNSFQQRQQLNDSALQIQRLLQRLRSDANWNNRTRLLWLKPGAGWCLGAGEGAQPCSTPGPLHLRAPYPGIVVQTLTDGMGFYGKKTPPVRGGSSSQGKPASGGLLSPRAAGCASARRTARSVDEGARLYATGNSDCAGGGERADARRNPLPAAAAGAEPASDDAGAAQ